MDDISTGTLVSLLVFLIVISAFFTSSETAMMALNRYKLKHLSNQGNTGAKRAEKLLEHPDRLISLTLFGDNLSKILASIIATVIGMRLYSDIGIAIAIGSLSLIILVFADVIPKTVANLYPKQISNLSSPVLTILMQLFFPIIAIINRVTNGCLFLCRLHPHRNNKTPFTAEELRTIVNEAGGSLPKRHQNMLLSILELEEVTVDDIMVPRNEIIGINVNDDWKSIMRQLTHAPHTRMVLYRDQIDEVVGMLRVREAYRMMVENSFSKENLLRAADEIYFIPQGTALNQQLLKFQRNKQRTGLIVNEYGDITGLITLEDILEEIVGEFTTSLSPSHADEITKLPDGSYMIEGSANIRDLNKSLCWNLSTNGPRTLNGLILEQLEDIPHTKVSIEVQGHHMEIIKVADNRIKQVKIFPDSKDVTV